MRFCKFSKFGSADFTPFLPPQSSKSIFIVIFCKSEYPNDFRQERLKSYRFYSFCYSVHIAFPLVINIKCVFSTLFIVSLFHTKVKSFFKINYSLQTRFSLTEFQEVQKSLQHFSDFWTKKEAFNNYNCSERRKKQSVPWNQQKTIISGLFLNVKKTGHTA